MFLGLGLEIPVIIWASGVNLWVLPSPENRIARQSQEKMSLFWCRHPLKSLQCEDDLPHRPVLTKCSGNILIYRIITPIKCTSLVTIRSSTCENYLVLSCSKLEGIVYDSDPIYNKFSILWMFHQDLAFSFFCSKNQ